MARFLSKEPAWGVDPLPVPIQKTAAFPPPAFKGGGGFPGGDDGGDDGGGKRNIPKDHPYDPKSLKPLAQALWAASVGMGHALTSYRFISRIKSSTISPDGMIGGRGYVMNVNDIRNKLHQACESLSTITDSLYDEINAPHWKPRLAELDESDAEDVERFVEESKAILENPEAESDEEVEEIEGKGDKDDKKGGKPNAQEEASEMPGGKDIAPGMGDKTTTPYTHPTQQKQAQAKRLALRVKQANSSLPVETLPGGPRIQHLDREDQDPNPPSSYTNDDWGTPSVGRPPGKEPGGTGFNQNLGQSSVPDSSSEPTPTEAWDFGLGYGAKGQGAGGYENPSGEGKGNKGVLSRHICDCGGGPVFWASTQRHREPGGPVRLLPRGQGQLGEHPNGAVGSPGRGDSSG